MQGNFFLELLALPQKYNTQFSKTTEIEVKFNTKFQLKLPHWPLGTTWRDKSRSRWCLTLYSALFCTDTCIHGTNLGKGTPGSQPLFWQRLLHIKAHLPTKDIQRTWPPISLSNKLWLLAVLKSKRGRFRRSKVYLIALGSLHPKCMLPNPCNIW